MIYEIKGRMKKERSQKSEQHPKRDTKKNKGKKKTSIKIKPEIMKKQTDCVKI